MRGHADHLGFAVSARKGLVDAFTCGAALVAARFAGFVAVDLTQKTELSLGL
jgi:hypothetical protein